MDTWFPFGFTKGPGKDRHLEVSPRDSEVYTKVEILETRNGSRRRDVDRETVGGRVETSS